MKEDDKSTMWEGKTRKEVEEEIKEKHTTETNVDTAKSANMHPNTHCRPLSHR
jgi:hypothetical protein